jgi:hypothetical protein
MQKVMSTAKADAPAVLAADPVDVVAVAPVLVKIKLDQIKKEDREYSRSSFFIVHASRK